MSQGLLKIMNILKWLYPDKLHKGRDLPFVHQCNPKAYSCVWHSEYVLKRDLVELKMPGT